MNELELHDLVEFICKECSADHKNDSIHINEAKLHLPSMIFGHDALFLANMNSRVCISFEAGDSLVGWALQVNIQFFFVS